MSVWEVMNGTGFTPKVTIDEVLDEPSTQRDGSESSADDDGA